MQWTCVAPFFYHLLHLLSTPPVMSARPWDSLTQSCLGTMCEIHLLRNCSMPSLRTSHLWSSHWHSSSHVPRTKDYKELSALFVFTSLGLRRLLQLLLSDLESCTREANYGIAQIYTGPLKDYFCNHGSSHRGNQQWSLKNYYKYSLLWITMASDV